MYFHVVSLRCPRISVNLAVTKLITTVFLLQSSYDNSKAKKPLSTGRWRVKWVLLPT